MARQLELFGLGGFLAGNLLQLVDLLFLCHFA